MLLRCTLGREGARAIAEASERRPADVGAAPRIAAAGDRPAHMLPRPIDAYPFAARQGTIPPFARPDGPLRSPPTSAPRA